MGVWLTFILLLFAAVELFQWFQHYILPIPFYLLSGLILAIASNAKKESGLPFSLPLNLMKSPSLTGSESSPNQE